MPLSLYAEKEGVFTVQEFCSSYKEKIEFYSKGGNYDSPWFNRDFWVVLDSLKDNNCEVYPVGLNIAGYLYYSENNIFLAKEALYKCESLIKRDKPSRTLFQNQLFIGLVYVLEKEFDNAIIYFKRSLDIAEELEQAYFVADAKLNLGLAFIGKKDFENAEQFLSEALIYFEQTPNVELLIGYVYLNLARIYDAKGNLDQTISYCDKAEDVWKIIRHRKGIILINQFKYELFHGRGQTQTGIPFLLKAKRESVETNTKMQLAEIYADLGEAYNILNKQEESIYYYKEAMSRGKDLPIDYLTDVVSILGQHYDNFDNHSDYKVFLDNIEEILIANNKKNELETSKLFSREILIDTLNDRTTNLQKINIKNEKQINNQFKTIGLILLLSFLVIWFVYQISEERKKLNLKINNQYQRLKDANDKLMVYSKKIQDQNSLYELKNRELKNFAQVASHDLKSPLRTILSFVGLLKLKSETIFNEKQLSYFNIIETSGQTLTKLIDDLLENAELDSRNLNLRQINVENVIEQVSLNLSEQIQSKNAVVTIDNSASIHLVCDEIKLLQVFQNLISNALKYSRANVDPVILIEVVQNNQDYVFNIIDNGIGVAVRDQTRIFNMFEKSTDSGNKDSYGIGLATCRKLIEAHGGEIWVKPNKPIGSIFSFSIPKKVIEN